VIDRLQRYPVMKDSGVPWLGQIPEHWEVAPAFAVYRPRQLKNTGLVESTVLSLSYGRIIVKAPEKLRGLVPESFETYQIVEPGNIIVRTTDLQNDQTSLRIGHAHHRGIITAAYMCLETKPIVLNEFGYQYLNAYDLLKIIYGFGSGLRQNLDFNDIKRMPVLVPRRDEQAAIVRFLDHADRRIQRYIRAKQKLIKLLEEQKQAIIHRAVTRGLDPNVRLKPSGVEWLGDVPEHWDVRKLKRLARLNPSRSESVKLRDSVDQATFLPMERISCDGEIDASLRLPIRDLWQGYTYFRRGDVLLAKITPCFENGKGACLTSLPTELGFGTTEFIVLRAGTLIRPDFLYQVTRLATFRSIGVESMTGSAGQQRVSQEFVANFQVPLPPLPEQAEIVEGLRMGILRIGSAITRAQSEISFLREYRTRLIADVVSGKLDVREAAARLSQEAEDLEPLEEAATDADGDEALADDANAATEEAET
jgi:type I restriction enzyme S subunit